MAGTYGKTTTGWPLGNEGMESYMLMIWWGFIPSFPTFRASQTMVLKNGYTSKMIVFFAVWSYLLMFNTDLTELVIEKIDCKVGQRVFKSWILLFTLFLGSNSLEKRCADFDPLPLFSEIVSPLPQRWTVGFLQPFLYTDLDPPCGDIK